MKPSRDIQGLLDVMAALRDPETGCPWDKVQTFRTIASYTIEEAYEVADAIERGDMADLRDELGDLLLQVAYHARIAEEAGDFAFPDVVEAITAKMIRRHPHVFGDADARASGMSNGRWEAIKAGERAAKGRSAAAEAKSLLGDIGAAMPAMTRAVKLQRRASTVGFDWNDARLVLDKIREEISEVEQELTANASHDRLEAEIGDVLFAVANLARHIAVDPETALRGANEKFRRRFAFIERTLGEAGRTLDAASLDEMEALWQQAKAGE